MSIRGRSNWAATPARKGRGQPSLGLLLSLPAALFLSTAAVGAAGREVQAQAFLARINAAIEALANRAAPEVHRGCAAFVASLIDLDAVAAVGAGRAWEKMAGAQRAAYREALAARLSHDCVNDNRDNPGRPATLVGTRRGDDGALLVATQVQRSGGEMHTVVWRLPASPQSRDRAVDFQIDGRSVALTLRDEADRAFDAAGGDAEAATRSLRR